MENAEELDGCDDPELPMKLHVKQWVAFYNNLDRKVQHQNIEHLILHCHEGVNDEELKAHLKRFGKVIKYDAENLQRAVIMCFYDENSKISGELRTGST